MTILIRMQVRAMPSVAVPDPIPHSKTFATSSVSLAAPLKVLEALNLKLKQADLGSLTLVGVDVIHEWLDTWVLDELGVPQVENVEACLTWSVEKLWEMMQ